MTAPLARRAELHSGIERRSCAFQLVAGEMRGAGAPALEGWQLSAYASVTNTPYKVVDEFGPFTETVHRGAFSETLARGPDVAFRVNHEGLALGRTRSGTLQLNEDTRGLRYSVSLDPESPNAVALRSAVNRRDVTESSFAFLVTSQEWDSSYTKRSIFGVDLDRGDVSAVTFGASPSTGDEGNATTLRADLSTAQLNDLPDSAFAYIEAGGTKDSGDKTVPRSKRHFCIIDAGHVQAALARIAGGAAFGKEAMPAVLKAAKKFGIHVSANAAGRVGESRSPLHAFTSGSHTHSHPANGSQGSWKTHTHTHSHDGDASHDHSHDADAMIADGATASDSMDQPSAEALMMPNYDLEARLAILRLKAGPPAPPLSRAEKNRRALALGAKADELVARRLQQHRRGTR